jgi:hypothetical protein
MVVDTDMMTVNPITWTASLYNILYNLRFMNWKSVIFHLMFQLIISN